jgi:predicted acylesterase/phospholipase RssA
MKTESRTLPRGPLDDADPPIHILLSLQGGGALGAFQVGIFEHLHNGLGVGGQIRSLSGVSIGAMNSAIYVANYRKDPIRALKKFWNDVSYTDSPLYPRVKPFLKDSPLEGYVYDLSLPANLLALVQTPNFSNLRMDVWNAFNWAYLWDVAPLRRELEKLIDLDELNSPDNPQLIITAVNIESGELEIFDNRKQRLSIDHVLASGSLPPAFSPTEINRQRYWDGSLFDNSPFMTLLRSLQGENILEPQDTSNPDEVLRRFEQDATKKRLITVELFPRSGDFPRTLSESFARVVEIQDRVKVTRRSIGAIYEFGVLVNWLSRFIHLFVDLSGGAASEQELVRSRDELDGLGITAKELNTARRVAREIARIAMKNYFLENRPGAALPGMVEEDCTVTTESIDRTDELQVVGLDQRSLAAINELAKLLLQAPPNDPDDPDAKQFFAKFSRCKLFINQVVRFSNLEFLPLKTTVRSGLLGSNDFSPSVVRQRFEAGLKVAQEQLFVAKFKDNDGKWVRDLMFKPPPNEG